LYINPLFIVKKVETIEFSPFTELLTEGFDNDQIWEEIASQNEPFLDYAKTALKSFTKKPTPQFESEDESVSGQSMDIDQEMEENEDMSEDEEFVGTRLEEPFPEEDEGSEEEDIPEDSFLQDDDDDDEEEEEEEEDEEEEEEEDEEEEEAPSK
jgi:U3 small nucleolar RNA-associated protein MPP10